MEIFFLDVAQGTCQIILLGERRAIVMDCGIPNDRMVVPFLRRMGVEHIERLIVSHSHDDHIGGAVTVLGAYQDRVSKICFVQDHKFLQSAFWGRISESDARSCPSRIMLTRQCNGNRRDMEFLRPGVLRPLRFPGKSVAATDLTAAGHSRNVACAGTVRVEATDAGLIVDRLNDHQRAVDQLSLISNGCPLCRIPSNEV